MTICPSCKTEVRDGARFCAGCGFALQGAPAPAAVAPGAPVARATTVAAASPGVPKYLRPPPGAVAGPGRPVAAAAAPSGSVPLWDLQRTLMRSGNTLSAALGKSLPPSTAFGGAVHRMLKAAFLDADVYREASAKASLNTEAAIVAAVALLGAVTGPAFLSLFTGGLDVMWTLRLLGTQAVFLAAFVVAASLGAPYVISKKLDAASLFRPIAYAQSVAVLGIVPVVGPFFTLWRFVTMTAAIKDSAGVETGKSVLLLLLGIVCGVVATAVLAPIVLGTPGGMGGLLR